MIGGPFGIKWGHATSRRTRYGPAPMTGPHPLPSALSVEQLLDRANIYFKHAETTTDPAICGLLRRLGRRFADLAALKDAAG